MDKITRYHVSWHLSGEMDGTHISNVQVTEGYSTVADIPKIIACARSGKPADAQYILIDQITALEG